MYKIASYVRNLAVIVSLLLSNNAFAGSGDSAVASINLSGNVPEVFSVTARGLPGDLDLTPGVSVTDRLIGILHFKFNENAASIKIASSTASGSPENASGAYSFGTAFKVAVTGACTSLDTTTLATPGVTLTQAGVDYKSTAAIPLVGSGIEEDCKLVANWGGTSSSLPLAGVFSMSVTITMVAL